MAGRFSVEAIFKATDRITAPVSKMQNRIGKMTRTMSNGFRRLNKTVGKFAAGIKKGAVVTAAALLIVGAAMSGAAMAGVNFEQAITDVGAVSLLTRSEIKPLEQLALELGRTTKFTATQAASAMEVLARAGFKSQEILQATPAILSAAAASGLEIAEVANHVSNALKGMGLDTSKAAEVADVLALASSKTNSSIGSLGESLSNVSSTARSLKIPFKEVVAGVALLQDVGLDASVAGSALNTMLTKMAAPTAGITKKMKKFGITFKDAKGDMLPFQKVLQQLSIASKKAGGNFDKTAFLAELVGLRGQKAASNLADLFEEGKFKKLVDQLGSAEGAAKKMADLRMDTVKGSFLLLGSAVDAVKVRIFGLNEGPLKKLIDSMTEFVGVNEELIAQKVGNFFKFIKDNGDDLIKTGKGILQLFGFLIAVITTVKVATLAYNSAMILIKGTQLALAGSMLILKGAVAGFNLILGAAKIAMVAFNLVMSLNPIGLVVAALGLLIAAGLLLIKNWDTVSAFFAGMWTGLIGIFQTSADAIRSIVSGDVSIVDLLMNAWEGFGLFMSDLWDGVVGVIVSAIDKIMPLIDDIASPFKNISEGLSGLTGSVKSFFGVDGGDETQGQAAPAPSIVSPQERVARSIEEQRSTSTAEVTLKADQGTRAEVTKGKMGPGLKLQDSGAF